jgi:hypothetical protein
MFTNSQNSFRYISPSKVKLITVLAFSMLMPLPAWSQVTDSVEIPITKFNVEGGVNVPVKGTPVTVDYKGKSYSGVKFTMQKWATNNAIRIPVVADADTYNTIQFKVRYSSNVSGTSGSSMMVLDNKGSWDSARLPKVSKKLDDGWHQVSWDLVHQPDISKGANLKELRSVNLGYTLNRIPEGETIEMTIVDMKFVSGLRASTGDPTRFDQWRDFISNYKPDYSDSSKYLLPPAEGRIAKPVAFVRDRKALGQIVVPSGASAPLSLAGEELSYWIQKITGAEIPRVTQPNSGNGPKILLGRQFAQEKYKADLDWLQKTGDSKGTDGFAIRTDKENIYIFGATDKGTLNGVSTFLENNTDIIWPRGIFEQRAVYTQKPSLEIVWGDAREMPATILRGWGATGQFGELDWQTRNRSNYAGPEGTMVKDQADVLQLRGNYVQFGGGHNISYFLNKNAAFYPVIDGQQVTEFSIWKHQPNFTAPGITDAVAANMIEYIKTRTPEGIDCVNINIEDNWGLSTDPKSLAPIKLPDGSTITSDDPAFRSTQFFIFLNDVVKKVHKVYPGMQIGTYAYFFTATVPKVDIDPHIRILFAPYPRPNYRQPLFSPINNHWWQQMKGWTNKTPNLIMREYYGIFNGFRPLAEVVAAELKSYKDSGINRFTAEMLSDGNVVSGESRRGERHDWDFMAMDYWIINRLYWNPDQDVEQLRKYYLRRTYQEAAPQMEKFYGSIRTVWFNMRIASEFTSGQGMMNDVVFAHGLEDSLRQELESAKQVVKNPSSRMMVDTLRISYEKWAGEVKKSKEKKPANTPTPAFRVTPEEQLRYGWSPSYISIRTDHSWALATYIDRDGQTIPAVRFGILADRVDLRPNTKGFTITNNFRPGLLTLESGDSLQFNISPEDKDNLSAPLQTQLTAVDKNNAKVTAPEEAFEKLPDGSLRVKWQLLSTEKFDATQIKQIVVTIPREVCEGQKTVMFYLTDVDIKRGQQP